MKNQFSLLFVAFAFMFYGCGEHFDDLWKQVKDSIGPGLNEDVKEEIKDELTGLIPASVIPNSIRSNIESSMSINEGTEPPIIKGQYKSAFMILIGSSLSNDDIGSMYNGYEPWPAIYVAFIEGPDGKLSYREKQGDETLSGSDDVAVEVVGKGNDFSAYLIAEGTFRNNTCPYSIRYKASTVISGTLTSDGIENFQYSFIMLEKSSDPSKCIVEVNTYRIFEDVDGLAEKVTWYR
jgi:hypothetical protein